MRMTYRRLLILGGVLGMGVLAAGAGAWALSRADGDGESSKGVTKGKGKIDVVDADGDRHEKEYEFGDEGFSRPYLGVELEDATDGARVEQVYPGTPAERAGFKEGDVIVRFDGERVDGPADLTLRILDADPGQALDIEVQRGGRAKTLSAVLEERRDGIHDLHLEELGRLGEKLGDIDLDLDIDFDFDALGEQMRELEQHLGNMRFELHMPRLERHQSFWNGRPRLGVLLVETTPELREHLGGHPETGVLVSRIVEGAPAERAGIRVGDLITAVDGRQVEDAGDIRQALADRDGETAEVQLIRDRRVLTIEVDIPSSEEQEDASETRTRRHAGRDRRAVS